MTVGGKGKETEKTSWGICCLILRGGAGLGNGLNVLLEPIWHIQCTEVDLGAEALIAWSVPWHPVFCHGCLLAAGTLVAFKCLTHANTMLICLVLSWKGVKKRAPHPFGWQLLGHSEQWGLWDTPEGNRGQSSSVASTATCLFAEGPRNKTRGEQTGGEPPEGNPHIGHRMLRRCEPGLEKNL